MIVFKTLGVPSVLYKLRQETNRTRKNRSFEIGVPVGLSGHRIVFSPRVSGTFVDSLIRENNVLILVKRKVLQDVSYQDLTQVAVQTQV